MIFLPYLCFDPNQYYEFHYSLYDASNTLLSKNDGVFKPDMDSENDIDNKQIFAVITGANDMAVTIHRQQTRNAFGEVVSDIDGRA